MIDWSALLDGAPLLLTWQCLLLMLGGVAFGVVLGAIPGLTASIGIALMLPVVMLMDPLEGLVLLTSIFTGGLFGGAITAVLINTPGTPAAVPTTFDGYPMAVRGEAARALGLALGASVAGGIFGTVILFLGIGTLATWALEFGPTEMVMVGVVTFLLIASLRAESMTKTLFAGAFGLLLGTVGMSNAGVVRGTYGVTELLDGVPQIAALIGLFCVSELLILIDRNYVHSQRTDLRRGALGEMTAGVGEAFRMPRILARSGVIGVIIGVAPAVGGAVASLLAYSRGKAAAKDKETWGTGNPRGIVAAESADNASEGGSLATMLVLGVPGSAATAMMLSAIIMEGWTPGPRLFIDHAPVMYGLLTSVFVQQGLLLLVGGVIALGLKRIVEVPIPLLLPVVAVLCLIGAFAVRGRSLDVFFVVAFGVLGYFLRRYGYPVIAVVLGLILGPLIDVDLERAVVIFGPRGFFATLVERPITGIMVALTVALFIRKVVIAYRDRRSGDTGSGSTDAPAPALDRAE